MSSAQNSKLAVLIDAENVPAKYAEAIFEDVIKFGEPTIRWLYCNVESPQSQPWLKKQGDLGMLSKHQPNYTSGKNAADISLVIDAMDVLHSGAVDGFVLVSSDSDFTRLAQRIREAGLKVYGFGEEKTPTAFRAVCNQFVTVENILQVTNGGPDKPDKAKLNEAYVKIRNVLKDGEDEEGWMNLGALGSDLLRRYPDFDSRGYGHAKLSGLISTLSNLKTRKAGNVIYVRDAKSNSKKE